MTSLCFSVSDSRTPAGNAHTLAPTKSANCLRLELNLSRQHARTNTALPRGRAKAGIPNSFRFQKSRRILKTFRRLRGRHSWSGRSAEWTEIACMWKSGKKSTHADDLRQRTRVQTQTRRRIQIEFRRICAAISHNKWTAVGAVKLRPGGCNKDKFTKHWRMDDSF